MDLEYEFTLIREELKTIAILMVSGKESDKIEAALKIGCLHNICHENSLKFKKREKHER
jgi:hypothetical protein